MRARVFDKEEEKYYIAEVFGVANDGWERYIVEKGECLVLVDYLDVTTEIPYKTNIETVDFNALEYKWSYIPGEMLREYERLKGWHYFRGYDFMWEHVEELAKLLETGRTLKHRFFAGTINTKLSGWNYVESQQDIEYLMEYFVGFHDSVLREVHYISGDYVDEEGVMTLSAGAGDRELQMFFDSDWTKSIEVVFLAPKLLQLVPPGENYTGELYDASVFLQEGMLHFYNSRIKEITNEYEGTYVKALGMRWREV